MKKEYALVIALIIGVFAFSYYPRISNTTPVASTAPVIDQSNCLSDDCLLVDGLEYPVGTLTTSAKSALDKALDDEYKAYSTYDSIISKLGTTRPFSMIIGAEEQHISQLKAIYTKYGETPISNKYLGKITSPATLTAACSAGVQAEIDNAKLYKEELLPQVVSYPDITQVFTSLMNASEQKHLPAFERCAGR